MSRVSRLVQLFQFDRLIYTTIMLMAVLIVYDGWTEVSARGVVAVVLGPMVAIFCGHVFADSLGTRIEKGQSLTGTQRRAIVVRESVYLLLAIPPLVIFAVLGLFGLAYSRIVYVIVLVGVLCLGAFGGIAGRRAGLTGWALVGSVAYGLLVGAIILLLRALLQPGEVALQH